MLSPRVFISKLRNRPSDVSADRPHFGPKQVRSIRGIKPGLTFIKVDPYQRKKILVTSEVVTLLDGEPESLYFKCISLDPEFYGPGDTEFLADCGVIPYHPHKRWNCNNHLLRTGERRLNDKEIEQVIIKMEALIESSESDDDDFDCEGDWALLYSEDDELWGDILM